MPIVNNLTKTTKTMLLSAASVCFVLLILGIVIILMFNIQYERPLPYAAGLVLGCLHTLIKIIWLEKSINRSLDAEIQGAANFAHLHYLGRYALTAAVFILVFLNQNVFGLFGTIAGVFSLRVAAHVTGRAMRDAEV